MGLPELITTFRKAVEDLVQANVRTIFKAKYGTKTLTAGSNTITFDVGTDDNYTSGTEYTVRFIEAVDSNNIDIRDAIYITSQTASAFVVNSARAGTLKWESHLNVPNFNFWT